MLYKANKRAQKWPKNARISPLISKHKKLEIKEEKKQKIWCIPAGIRTRDLWIRSPTRYPLRYRDCHNLSLIFIKCFIVPNSKFCSQVWPCLRAPSIFLQSSFHSNVVHVVHTSQNERWVHSQQQVKIQNNQKPTQKTTECRRGWENR